MLSNVFSLISRVDPSTMSARMLAATLTALVLPPLMTGLYVARRISKRPQRKHVVLLLVLGDIGRSPRMMYHASSFARHGWEAVILGYTDTPLMPALLESPHVHPVGIASPPKLIMAMPWPVRAPIRVIYQIMSIIYTVLYLSPVHPEVIMVQNPPSIPTLLLARFLSRTCGSKLIIDWHNTGYSILAMRTGEKSILTRIAKWFESYFGRHAHAHLFVTRALEGFLSKAWALQGIRAILHDRPPAHFRRTGAIHQAGLCRRMIPELEPTLPPTFLPDDDRPDHPETTFTILRAGMPELRSDRPALLISSTSWTADEDFSLLLTALDAYQAAIDNGTTGLPRILVIITGKGDLRKPFEQEVASREKQGGKWKDVAVRCHFLPAKDYPVLLGCADLGVSLHTSSSGRDLPMKVVDMFGCGVPVLAKGFGCIDELVKHGKNGLVFNSGEELGQQLVDTLKGFPRSSQLDQLQSYFKPSSPRSGASTPTKRADYRRTEELEDEWTNWDENWDRVVYRGILHSSTWQRVAPLGKDE